MILILCVALTAELILAGALLSENTFGGGRKEDSLPALSEATMQNTTEPLKTEPPAPTTTEPVETTQPPTEPAPTEPPEEHFWLTFAGDCTLGSTPGLAYHRHSFIKVVKEDYDFPFANVAQYFKNDDFTIVNLESVLADSGKGASKRFVFRGPTAYTNILTGSSVEAVTLANNHSKDFGTAGYNSTKQALEGAGVTYVEENKTALYTTESGLKIGLYADAFSFSKTAINNNIQKLKDEGAEVIICAFHWGKEGSYRPNSTQKTYAKIATEAGAHIVYGHHPHVLQKIVQKENSVIFYSLGNFSFGGHADPQDYDSALLQQEIIREPDGTIRLGELRRIPVNCSSIKGRNNYQPTPCEEGSKMYDRILTKLDGTFKGKDLVVNYSKKETSTTPSTGGTETPAPTSGGGS